MRQIKILADERSAEALSDMLMDAGALSATIEDADAESTDEKPLYGEPGLEPDNCAWPRSIVSILADDDFDLETSLAIAVKALKCEKPELLGTEEVEDADWVRITQAQFQPTQVSDRLWIVPTLARPSQRGRHQRAPRSGRRLRHRLPSDHPPLPAVA